jgi:hypothetical protein
VNLGELVTAVERRTGILYDPDATKEVINEALQAISKHRDWGWLEADATLTGDGTVDFTLPAGFAKARSVKVDDTPYPMVPITTIDDHPYTVGWTIHAEELIVSPAPATAAVVVLRYYGTEAALALDADEPVLPVEWHPAVVHYASAVILERAGDKEGLGRADRSMARYKETLGQMVAQANRAKGPHRVRIRPGSLL